MLRSRSALGGWGEGGEGGRGGGEGGEGRSQVGGGGRYREVMSTKFFLGGDGMSKEGFHSKDKGVFWLNMRN